MRIAYICLTICFIALALVIYSAVKKANNECVEKAYSITLSKKFDKVWYSTEIQADSIEWFNPEHIIVYKDGKKLEIKAEIIKFRKNY